MGSERCVAWRRLAWLWLALWAPAAAAETGPFQKGVALGGWWRDDYLAATLPAQLDALRASGVEWIELTPRWFQAERDSTEIAPHPELSPSDASLRRATALARERGLRVFLKPQLDLTGAGWRGEIRPRDETAWRAWFASYERFILHYAALARETGASLLCVGVELDATRHRERDWRAVIAAVRRAFPGPLTWAANWGREADVRFWDALDYAGVDEYALLEAKAAEDDAALRVRAERRRDELRRFAAAIRRPILFTEIGARSVSHATVNPFEWQRHGRVDLAMQDRLVGAAIEAFGSEPWLAGAYWWQWLTAPPADASSDDDFTLQGKPAWERVRRFYAER